MCTNYKNQFPASFRVPELPTVSRVNWDVCTPPGLVLVVLVGPLYVDVLLIGPSPLCAVVVLVAVPPSYAVVVLCPLFRHISLVLVVLGAILAGLTSSYSNATQYWWKSGRPTQTSRTELAGTSSRGTKSAASEPQATKHEGPSIITCLR